LELYTLKTLKQDRLFAPVDQTSMALKCAKFSEYVVHVLKLFFHLMPYRSIQPSIVSVKRTQLTDNRNNTLFHTKQNVDARKTLAWLCFLRLHSLLSILASCYPIVVGLLLKAKHNMLICHRILRVKNRAFWMYTVCSKRVKRRGIKIYSVKE
jgi:hypothetical protein